MSQIAAFRKEYGEILEELGRPLVVVIDNLDRGSVLTFKCHSHFRSDSTFPILEEGDGGELPTGVPKSWSTNPTTKPFILWI